MKEVNVGLVKKMGSIYDDLVEGITQVTENKKGNGNAKEAIREGAFLDISKIPLDEYINLKDYLSAEEVDRVKRWSEWPKQERMVELYFEVEKLPRYKEKEKALIMQLLVVSNLNKIIRNCTDVSQEEHESIKIAEWRLYDYYVGNNIHQNKSDDDVIQCYKDWCADYFIIQDM